MPMTRRQLLQAGGVTAAWLVLPFPARAMATSSAGDVRRFGLATGRTVPAWFGGSRVQGHTRLSLGRWQDTDEFTNAGAGFKALGARAFARHAKTGDEDPWDRAIVQQTIDEAHREGLKIITYYWHMSEASMVDLHREWVCRWPDGTEIEGPRGVHLDITGPYGDVVLTRLRELADMGSDGFYFDYRHLPPAGCWGSALEDAWITETGQPRAPTQADADYLRFLDFKARKIEATFISWRDAVKAEHPNVVFIVSTTTVPALTSREMTTRLARIADSPKNEYRHAVTFSEDVFVPRPGEPALATPEEHVRQALGWTVLRDAADGRPPHIWAGGVPNIDHARAFVGSLVTFGCIASMDVAERSLLGRAEPPAGKTPMDGLAAAFALSDAVSPHMVDTEPLRWAAVHFSERTRNVRADDRAAWREVLWPLVGTYQVLCELGLPAGVVNDFQLAQGELDGYRLLVLPNPDELTKVQQQAVATFRTNGGVVIANDPAWAWSDPHRTRSAASAFRTVLEPHVGNASVRVAGGPKRMYSVSYRGPSRLVVAVTNDFSWVQITQADQVPPAINQPAPAAEGVRVVWRRGHGLPELPVVCGHSCPLQAIEAVSGKTLGVGRVGGGYRVDLPAFAHMALLVVTSGE